MAPDDPIVSTLAGHYHRVRAGLVTPPGGADAQAEVTLARRAYRHALRRDDTLAEAYLGLGLTYLLVDDGSPEAPNVLEAAYMLRPGKCETNAALGKLLVSREQASAATPYQTYLARACQSKPNGTPGAWGSDGLIVTVKRMRR
jgi:hypothetical protein